MNPNKSTTEPPAPEQEKVSAGQIDHCLVETHKHVRSVQAKIMVFVKELLDRAMSHDKTKFEEPELSIFAAHTDKLAKITYGSEEYKESLEATKQAIEHHHAKNRHHPEFHKNGINDMTLVDLVELLSDWKASTERVRNGNIRKSLETNVKRYNIDSQLAQILDNTVREYFED